QERMLVVARKGKEDEVKAICKKWDLHSEIIGKVTRGATLSVHHNGRKVASIPAESLVLGGGAPVYHREDKKPAYIDQLHSFDLRVLPEPDACDDVLIKLLSSPNIASKEWVTRQYDHMVRTNTVVLPGSDAAVIRIKGTRRALAMKTDCNGRYVYLNPRVGAKIAVAESARNVVCSGGQPVAITNCLNFGNPYKPEIFWQFKEAVAGIGEACLALNTPVTGGNVSFYNENPEGAVYPTPVIGMIGIVEDLRHVTTAWFKAVGDLVVLLGKNRDEIGGSEYLKVQFGRVAGDCPRLDLNFEKRLQSACLEAIREGSVQSAHDVAEGGLAVALAESCFLNPHQKLGAVIKLHPEERMDFTLFGEDQSRIVISVKESNLKRMQEICERNDIPLTVLGRVEGDSLVVNDVIDLSIEKLFDTYYNAIRRKMES
ncbi:MAG TPA: AIR synthase related protein, partial [bacterium]